MNKFTQLLIYGLLPFSKIVTNSKKLDIFAALLELSPEENWCQLIPYETRNAKTSQHITSDEISTRGKSRSRSRSRSKRQRFHAHTHTLELSSLSNFSSWRLIDSPQEFQSLQHSVLHLWLQMNLMCWILQILAFTLMFAPFKCWSGFTCTFSIIYTIFHSIHQNI